MEWLWDLLVNLHWGAVGQIIMIDIQCVYNFICVMGICKKILTKVF